MLAATRVLDYYTHTITFQYNNNSYKKYKLEVIKVVYYSKIVVFSPKNKKYFKLSLLLHTTFLYFLVGLRLVVLGKYWCG